MKLHSDSGLWLDPTDWKLQCSTADWILVEKAATRTTETASSLDDAEKERLLDLCGPFWGRVLGRPEALSPEEKHIAKGWPARDIICANIAEVTATTPNLEVLTPEAFISKAATGAEWMTLEQTNLLDQRFNKLEPGQRRTQYSMEHFDRYRAGWLVASAEEKQAYRNAQLRGQLLRRPGLPLDVALLKEEIEESCELGNYDSDIRQQPLWIQEMFRKTQVYGFPITYTTQLHEYLADKLSDAESSSDDDDDDDKDKDIRPSLFLANFIKQKVFGVFGSFRPMAQRVHPGRRGHWEGQLFLRGKCNVSRTPTDHLIDDGAQTRFAHRMVRYGGSLELERARSMAPKSMFDEQYFVVLDTSILPFMFGQYRIRDEIEIIAWLYDADWEPPSPTATTATPPSDGNTKITRDQDGYAGRIKVSYGFHLFVGIYPHLLDLGFNLKDIWAIHRSEEYVYRTQDLSELPLSDA